MVRIAAAIGLLFGAIEVFALYGAAAWHGSALNVSILLAVQLGLGAVAGSMLALGRRFRGAREAPTSTALIAAGISVAAGFAILGIGAHTQLGGLGLAPLGLVVLAAAWVATRPSAPSSSAGPAASSPSRIPALAGIALLLVAAASGTWVVADGFDDTPIGKLIAVTPSAPAAYAVGALAEHEPPKLMMIGVDGGSWDVILPLVDRGELPNFQYLLQDGVAGIIESSHDAFSPIAWTTASTGKEPDHHGLFNLAHTRSTHRKVRTLYSMLGDMGYESLVANIPGTFPAEPIPGAILAGFPVQKESMNTLGHLYTSRPADAFTMPSETLHMSAEPLQLQGGSGARRGTIDHRESIAQENFTGLAWLQQTLGFGRSLYSGWGDRRYGRIAFEETADGLRFELADEQGRPVTIDEGAWSPWIRIDRIETPLVFRLRVVERNEEAISVYATPLFPLETDARIQPPELAAEIDRRFGPYVVEGAGWMLFQAPELLPALLEHQFQVAEQKRHTVTTLWRERPWDALFYIVTLTDRIQHSFWSFMDHESYPAIPNAPAYPYEPRDGFDPAAFESAVADSYRFADSVIGDFLEKAGPDTVVLLVSDHGGTSGMHNVAPGAGIHHPDGIYLFHGGIFRRDAALTLARETIGHPDPRLVGDRLRLQDLAPTLLAALGLPIARDFDGGPSSYVLEYLKRNELAPELVATYEREQDRREVDSGELDESAMEQLRSLGYVQ